MGCLNSNERSREKRKARAKKINKIETMLFIKTMKFDMNLGSKPQLTIEARFARENTNDLGERLLPQIAHVIIAEFKKFIFLTAMEILTRK